MDLITLGLAKKYVNKKIKEAIFDGAKVVLDSTLTQTGCAAEAQVVGNRIKEVEAKIPSVDKATVGQALAVKAVDENNKPTEWEAVDIPEVPEQAQADWNQNDPDAKDYIKNKPLVSEEVTTLETITQSFDGIAYNFVVGADLCAKLWEKRAEATYIVDGVECAYNHDYAYMEQSWSYNLSGRDQETIVFADSSGDNGVDRLHLITPGGSPLPGTINFSVEVNTGSRLVVDEKFIPDSIARKTDIPQQTNADWNQNDKTALDFIKNRPFYNQFGETILIDEEITVTDPYYENDQFYYIYGKTVDLGVEGGTYDISLFGETIQNLTATNGKIVATFSNGVTVNFSSSWMNSNRPDGLTRPFTTKFKIVCHGNVYYPFDKRYLPSHTHDASSELSGAVPVANGGTGAKTVTGARGAMGLGYGICSTISSSADKIVNVGVDGFVLTKGALVGVNFRNNNSKNAPTLNIDGTGAKPIYNSKTNAAAKAGDLNDGLHLFMYDGSNWILLNPRT